MYAKFDVHSILCLCMSARGCKCMFVMLDGEIFDAWMCLTFLIKWCALVCSSCGVSKPLTFSRSAVVTDTHSSSSSSPFIFKILKTSTFFHARLGYDIRPRVNDPTWWHLTRVNSITSGPVTIRQFYSSIHGYRSEFSGIKCPSWHQPARV